MTTFVAGGTGFIGRRLIPLLAQRGEEVVVMDINPQTADYSAYGKQVRVVRGDVSQFDDFQARIIEAKPDRVINLAYYIGSDLPPRVAFKLNVLGMDNCFEAARLAGVNRVVYASSVAVSGEQKNYGERMVDETDFRHGRVQYALHKIFNEWQAQDYREKHGMEITAIRPANVTGNDKIFGSVDHVFIVRTRPARGQPVNMPYKDAMRSPVHVDEIAEIFARVTMKDKPEHAVYNTGGQTISLGGEIAGHRARIHPRRADHLRSPDRRARAQRQFPDRQFPGGVGIRHPVPPLPRAGAADHQRSARGTGQTADRRAVARPITA